MALSSARWPDVHSISVRSGVPEKMTLSRVMLRLRIRRNLQQTVDPPQKSTGGAQPARCPFDRLRGARSVSGNQITTNAGDKLRYWGYYVNCKTRWENSDGGEWPFDSPSTPVRQGSRQALRRVHPELGRGAQGMAQGKAHGKAQAKSLFGDLTLAGQSGKLRHSPRGPPIDDEPAVTRRDASWPIGL